MIRFNRLAILEDFNAASTKQLLTYYHWKKYPIQLDRKKRTPTTSEEAIERTLIAFPEDEVLPKAIELRHLKTGLGSLKDASLGRDGRFHSEFPFEPDTGRLASKRPNLQNQPQGRDGGIAGEIATLIRSTIIPDDGKVLIEFDWKAIEAVLTGWFANDPGYIRLSLIDSHGFYTSYILEDEKKIPKAFVSDDPELKEKLEWLKLNFNQERALGKMVNLALGYGMGPRLLARKLRCSFQKAIKYIQLKDAMAPVVTKWKGLTQRQAHTQGYLLNPFGYKRHFFSVFSKKKDGEWDLGPEANEALAFLPQSTAAAMLRWILVELEALEKEFDFELLIPIHDAVLIQTAPKNVKRVIKKIKEVMEREWPELNGLSIKVSVKQCKLSESWGDMKDFKGD